MEKVDSSKRFFYFINIVCFCIMFYLSRKTPLYSDDLNHSLNVNGEKISSIREILESTVSYYYSWGGRAISHIIFQYFLAFNKPLYDVINAIVYVVYACIIHRYAFREKISNLFLIIIYCFLWIFTPSFGGSYLWLTGSVTYLWEMLPIFLFGLLYFRKWQILHDNGDLPNEHKKRKIFINCVGMTLLGVVAGWSIEPASCTLLFSITIILLWLKMKRTDIGLEYKLGWIGLVTGFCFLMLSPGNFVRAGVVNESNNILLRYLFRIGRETYYACSYLAIPFGVAVALLVMDNLMLCENKGDGNSFIGWLKKYLCNPRTIESAWFLLLSFISVYCMTFSAAYANRILITPIALILISIGISIKKLFYQELPKEICSGISIAKTVIGILLLFLVVYCLVQLFTAMLTCSIHEIPIEKYINYHYGEAEVGIID